MKGENSKAYGAFASRGAILSLALSMLLSSLGTSIANVALPTLETIFNATFQEIQWVTLAYLLTITILIVSAGRLGDIVGRKMLLLVGLSLFTIASLLCGLSNQLWLLITFRAMQGIGAAIMMSLTIALVGAAVNKEKTGGIMGLLGTMSAIGTASGPALGGILISKLGWQFIFLINIPIGILAVILAFKYLPNDGVSAKQRQGFDVFGTFFLAITLATYALSMTAGHGNFGTANLSLLTISIISVILFILTQAKVKSPLLKLPIFKNKEFSVGLAANGLVSTVMMATLMVGPFYLSGALGLNETFVGLVMSAGPIISALSGVPAGRLVDRFGAHVIILVGLTGIAAGTIALTILPAKLGTTGYILAIAILTPSYQLFQAANNTAVMMDVEQDRRGVISGILSLSRNLGLITGASVMGAIFAHASGVSESRSTPEAIGHGMQLTFTVSGVLIFLALTIVVANHVVSKGQLLINKFPKYERD